MATYSNESSSKASFSGESSDESSSDFLSGQLIRASKGGDLSEVKYLVEVRHVARCVRVCQYFHL